MSTNLKICVFFQDWRMNYYIDQMSICCINFSGRPYVAPLFLKHDPIEDNVYAIKTEKKYLENFCLSFREIKTIKKLKSVVLSLVSLN